VRRALARPHTNEKENKMQLNLQQTQAKFEDFMAVDGNTDRRNLNCTYYEGGGPSCVMAHFFIWLNIDLQDLEELQLNGNETSVVGNDTLLLPYFDEASLHWLDRIQGKADDSSNGGYPTWKQALYDTNQDFDGDCELCNENG